MVHLLTTVVEATLRQTPSSATHTQAEMYALQVTRPGLTGSWVNAHCFNARYLAHSRRRVLSVAHHPFIVDMDYAFQTPTMAIMCLDFVTGGDLQVIY